MLDVKKKYISTSERIRIERRKERLVLFAMWLSAMALCVMGIYALDKELEYEQWQNKCWAQEAQTGEDLDCQDDNQNW